MESFVALAPILAGPASAAVSLLIIIYGIYRIVDTRVVPVLESVVKRHLAQVDRLITSHDKDREVLGEGLLNLRKDVDTMSHDMRAIRTHLETK